MEEYSNLNRWSAWDTTRINRNDWWDGLVVLVKDDTYRQKKENFSLHKDSWVEVCMYECVHAHTGQDIQGHSCKNKF